MEGEVFGDRVSVSHGEMLIHTKLSLEVRLGVGIGFELKSRLSSAKKIQIKSTLFRSTII